MPSVNSPYVLEHSGEKGLLRGEIEAHWSRNGSSEIEIVCAETEATNSHTKFKGILKFLQN